MLLKYGQVDENAVKVKNSGNWRRGKGYSDKREIDGDKGRTDCFEVVVD